MLAARRARRSPPRRRTAGAVTVQIPFPRDPGTLTPLTFTLGYPLLTLVYDTVTWRDAQGVPRPWLARSVRGARRRPAHRRAAALGAALARRPPASRRATSRSPTTFMRERRHPRFAPQLAGDRGRARARRPHGRVRAAPPLDRLRRPAPRGRPDPAGPPLARPARRPACAGGRAGGQRPVPLRGRGARTAAPRLVAVPDYFRGRPRAERIEVPIVREARDMLATMQRGGADTLPFTLTADQVRALEAISVRAARTVRCSTGRCSCSTSIARRSTACRCGARSPRRSTCGGSRRPRVTARWRRPASCTRSRAGRRSPPRPRGPPPGRPLADLDLPRAAGARGRQRSGPPRGGPPGRAGAAPGRRRRPARARCSAATSGGPSARVAPAPNFDLAIWGIPAARVARPRLPRRGLRPAQRRRRPQPLGLRQRRRSTGWPAACARRRRCRPALRRWRICSRDSRATCPPSRCSSATARSPIARRRPSAGRTWRARGSWTSSRCCARRRPAPRRCDPAAQVDRRQTTAASGCSGSSALGCWRWRCSPQGRRRSVAGVSGHEVRRRLPAGGARRGMRRT